MKGTFVSDKITIAEKLTKIKAFIFDWDGVFNDGNKTQNQPSGYSEVDSMGINLLRFAYWLTTSEIPTLAIITGAENPSALEFAKREHFDCVYMHFTNKKEAFQHFCTIQDFKPEETAYFFDDINDLVIAKQVGLRWLIQHEANPLFREWVSQQQYCDYITQQEGGKHAIREVCEMIWQLRNQYAAVIEARIQFEGEYQTYFQERQKIETKLFKKEKITFL
ncbi:MAG: phosphatase [Cytophagales bacterium]|nr:MAG: phosphatase [Cytophagales bacterium]